MADAKNENDECPYTATAETVPGAKGCWATQKVTVRFNGEPVGSFDRNYGAYGVLTFAPFSRDGRWYALYSSHYTATRIMSLPDCKDLGGEPPTSFGFCPTEIYIPELCARVRNPADPKPYNPRHDPAKWAKVEVDAKDGHRRYYWPAYDKDRFTPEEIAAYETAVTEFDAAHAEWRKRNPFVSRYADFALVSGCHWGDDSSWKVEMFDLTRAPEGVITRSQPFGYHELPGGVGLKIGVRVSDDEFFDEPVTIEIASTKSYPWPPPPEAPAPESPTVT